MLDKPENQMDYKKETCKAVVMQKEAISASVKVEPFVDLGKVKVHCDGKPVLHNWDHCPSGCCKHSCSFTICQKLLVEIPIEFGTDVDLADCEVKCETSIKDHKPPKEAY